MSDNTAISVKTIVESAGLSVPESGGSGESGGKCDFPLENG